MCVLSTLCSVPIGRYTHNFICKGEILSLLFVIPHNCHPNCHDVCIVAWLSAKWQYTMVGFTKVHYGSKVQPQGIFCVITSSLVGRTICVTAVVSQCYILHRSVARVHLIIFYILHYRQGFTFSTEHPFLVKISVSIHIL